MEGKQYFIPRTTVPPYHNTTVPQHCNTVTGTVTCTGTGTVTVTVTCTGTGTGRHSHRHRHRHRQALVQYMNASPALLRQIEDTTMAASV